MLSARVASPFTLRPCLVGLGEHVAVFHPEGVAGLFKRHGLRVGLRRGTHGRQHGWRICYRPNRGGPTCRVLIADNEPCDAGHDQALGTALVADDCGNTHGLRLERDLTESVSYGGQEQDAAAAVEVEQVLAGGEAGEEEVGFGVNG